MGIGRLERVDIRKIWKHEQYDFSDWLAKKENIEELNNILGVSLVDVEKEKAVGDFRCDLYGIDEGSGKVVLIENQLDSTNHDHLGKIITYGAVLNASVIVWIVTTARQEHRKAIEWLNSHFDDEVSFFLIEVKAYKIGNSDPAPQFNIVEQPNDFAIGVKTAKNDSEVQRLAFWSRFNEVLESENYPLNKRKATTHHWYDISMGSSNCHLSINLVNKDNKIRVCLYITNNKEFYDELYTKKDEIENKLGYELEWNRLDDAIASTISTYIMGLDFKNPSNYDELIKKSICKVLELRKVFKEYI